MVPQLLSYLERQRKGNNEMSQFSGSLELADMYSTAPNMHAKDIVAAIFARAGRRNEDTHYFQPPPFKVEN
jgi:hypothetical protein